MREDTFLGLTHPVQSNKGTCEIPGACCFNGGSCSVLNDESSCENLGGYFLGGGEACPKSPCEIQNLKAAAASRWDLLGS